jgi:starch synthase
LVNTVVDADESGGDGKPATGIKFGPVTAEQLTGALRRANVLFGSKPVWRQLQQNGMAVDVSWRNRASQYAELYRQIIKARWVS